MPRGKSLEGSAATAAAGPLATRWGSWAGRRGAEGWGSLRGGVVCCSSRSRALLLCSASRVSKRFLRPSTALRWLKECVLHVRDLVHGFRAVISRTPQWMSGLNSRSDSLL